ncbi:MAG: hypothetical protein Q7S96_03080 [bacterium]|nr:hypothetical protein [bacterium]
MDIPVLLRVGKVVVGVLLTFVLPGVALSYIAFPFHDRFSESSHRGMDWIERATLTVLGSILVTSGVVAVAAPRIARTAGPHATQQLFVLLALVTVTLACIALIVHYAYRRLGKR